MLQKISIVLLLFIISSCAPKTFQVLDQKYSDSGKKFEASVTILPFTSDFIAPELLQEYRSNSKKPVGVASTNNRELYKNYFGIIFSETITGEVNDLLQNSSLDFLDEVSFQDTTLNFDEEPKLYVVAPIEGKLHTKEKPTDFTLLTQVTSWEVGFVEEQSKPIGGSNEQRYEFSLGLQYLIWDNSKETIAGYGFLEEKRNFTKIPERRFYIDFFETISRKIVRKSPLQERF